MSAHTNGPWVVCFETFCGVKRAFHIAGKPHGSSRPIAAFSNDDWRGVDIVPEELEANGRLLAAAPEMLGTLERILAYFDDRSEGEYFTDRASPIGNEEARIASEIREVVSKARGHK